MPTESLVGLTAWYAQTSERKMCFSRSSRNGGSCYMNQTGFACACPAGFTGICCDTSTAINNPCYTNPCLNSGTCQVFPGSTYRCVCPLGFLGSRCEQRICDPNPCLYGGVCLPLGNTFQCQCPAQYTGSCCELLVATTLAPNACNTQPCLNGGTCRSTSATGTWWTGGMVLCCNKLFHFSAFVCSCTASYYGRCCEVRNYCQPNPW